MDTGLARKTVFISGASGGIGRVLAEGFAREGAHLLLQAHSQADALGDWVRQQDWRERALVVEADVCHPRELSNAVKQGVARWDRLDICVVCAGIWPEESLPLHEMSEERILRTIDVNLFGAIWTARAFLASLARSGPRQDGHGASLLLIGSTAGRFGEQGHCEYAVSKAGMYGLLRSLKNEIAQLDPYGRVNLVEPGWTVTPMAREALEDDVAVTRITRSMALRQIARAEDIAPAVVFLSSPLLARHVSGEIITIAGGMEGRTLWEDHEIDPAAIRRRLDQD